MNAADIYRYSERGKVDQAIRAMQDRITEELHAARDQIGGLSTQDAKGREEYRSRLGRMQARRESWDVTAEYYRNEYDRIEREVQARWGWDA